MRTRGYSVIFMFLLTLACTGLLSVLQELNAERIERNRLHQSRAVTLRVAGLLPPQRRDPAALAARYAARIRPLQLNDAPDSLAILAPDGTTITGFVIPLNGSGFWGPMQGMLALDRTCRTILGLAFYRHTETPGLGGRITEKWFSDQFTDRPLPPPRNGRYFELRRAPARGDPHALDAITGATGTSTAVQELLNTALRRYLPRLQAVDGESTS